MNDMTKIEKTSRRHRGERIAFVHAFPDGTDADFRKWVKMPENSEPLENWQHHRKISEACERALADIQPDAAEVGEDLTYAWSINETFADLWEFLARKWNDKAAPST